MKELLFNKISKPLQYLFSILLICLVAGICFILSDFLNYQVVAFVLLVTVSIIAVSFDILPVLFAALLSALIWDYFFIPPHFTLQVGTTEDSLLLMMYFVVALVSGVLTYKIRRIEKIALQKEEKANTIKLYNTLLNSLSHELRTPISTIIGATDNLLLNKSISAPNKQELTIEISKAAFRLNRQVDNLLNMSRLNSGFIEPKKDWCDINELVYDVVRRIEENKIEQAISINISPELPFFKLDKGMLEQVLYNVINNAVLHTEAHCKIDIAAVCHVDVLQIIIEDNGKGFPNAELEHVFDKFYRLNNSKAGGTGLGLSIVKGFTEALGGIVILENIPRMGGARFTIEIPAATSYLKNLKNE
ncbi:MAG: DUF4118 domain-containing protein [Sphingobacteriaceae bacterium]|nr:DUF4118 domain-containing protein [Sphingobacteriaceae bacterium]